MNDQAEFAVFSLFEDEGLINHHFGAVLFCHPDVAHGYRDVAMDLDTWGRKGGVTTRWPDETAEAVAWSLAHPAAGRATRRAMARDLFFNPGRATDAAMRWLEQRFAQIDSA